MFNTNELWDYIDNYKFSEALVSFRAAFFNQSQVKTFISQNSTAPFESYVNDFWSIPEASHERLKQKYSIPLEISYASIIKAFPTISYINYLKCFWSSSSYISLIKEKYLFSDETIMDLSFPIEFPPFHDDFCLNCLENNIFMYEIIISQHGDFRYQIYCKLCGYESDNTISRHLANSELRKLINALPERINSTIEKFHHIKCPECNGSLRCKRDNQKQSYNIVCNRCSFTWNR